MTDPVAQLATASMRNQAWRFVHPDLDAPVAYAGLQYDASGGLELVSRDASVRQSLLLLLSVSPGERVMRPDYGCDLRRLAFAPNDDTTAGLAIHYVRHAIARWEPRVEVLSVDAGPGRDGNRLDILLEYRVRFTGRRDELTISLDLGGRF